MDNPQGQMTVFKISCWMPQGIKANLHPVLGNNTDFLNRLVIGSRSEIVWLGMLSFMLKHNVKCESF